MAEDGSDRGSPLVGRGGYPIGPLQAADPVRQSGDLPPRRTLLAPRLSRLLKAVGLWISIFLLVSPGLFVFLWMLSLSLKSDEPEKVRAKLKSARLKLSGKR